MGAFVAATTTPPDSSPPVSPPKSPSSTSSAVPIVGTRLVDGLGCVRGPLASSYVFREGGKTYLIDTGFPGAATHLRQAFRNAGVPLREVTDILLTHQHPDHMGGAAYLRWVTNAKVACHAMDAPAVEGRGPRLAPFMIRVLFSRHPVHVDRVLKDGDTVGPFTVIGTPGHTLGSVAYYHPERKILFAGDALVSSSKGLDLPSRYSNFDPDTAIDSVEKLAALDVRSIFCGHGRPVLTNAGPLLHEAARRLSKMPEHKWWTLAGPEGHPETHPDLGALLPK